MTYQLIHLKYAPLDRSKLATAVTASTIFSIVFFMLYDLPNYSALSLFEQAIFSLRSKTG